MYDGSGSTDWDGSTTLCGKVDSGGGMGKWKMPTIEQWCGGTAGVSRYTNETSCTGGFYSHGIKNVTFAGAGRVWPAYMWSSSAIVGDSYGAWIAYLSSGGSGNGGKDIPFYGVVCVQ